MSRVTSEFGPRAIDPDLNERPGAVRGSRYFDTAQYGFRPYRRSERMLFVCMVRLVVDNGR